ncbi:5-dehydro-4-deoxy-D-glucuronate isomerase [Longimicrobium terrae]|uniref:4-deoxy-L-threo-5-hexosulose-uronate ketol-isomerase n=1 Tax=Longimicrobium terrae TaxID=1639882 RepID=A0A841H7U4_9BACT|nr:5-dehydro-4-deoxy-D-glucuronate isomerase [Longimicrobium terrae]MBB4639625.1 4-deoxy-L-threo-5-hexosulose-uronate ketol-isomerase [Longimicrobium terrae]MBB6073972.1 4-deoxy-L-threo-5-hexosulose-uronate ketol-isomerase [Longimicrobium terrae]NNC28293.1 5-dehydro-4-deoxy-D-glucuronate isomerase [Longimicrobium terrae]
MMHYLPGPAETRRMTTSELRAAFLLEDLFRPGEVTLRFVDLDRAVVGAVVPTDGPLSLDAPEAMAAEYFTERRELGILNVGAAGSVTVDGERFALQTRDVLYVGRGSRDIRFESDDASSPALFYLISYPAHASHPTTLVREADAEANELGSQETANRRILRKYIHPNGVTSAQLVMGVTELLEGNVWNTMPSHTHARRTEIYLYFQVPQDSVVIHLMGEPDESRHLVMRDEQVALSPGWSIHSGCGTRGYTFCWAMGGENQVFADMQAVAMDTLR